MKKLFLTALMFCGAASAQTHEECEWRATLSESIMRARHSGMTLSHSLGIVEKNPSVKEVAYPIVLMAYSEPRFTTPRHQAESISEFRNKIHLDCIRSIK
jgi:hypothetical protein